MADRHTTIFGDQIDATVLGVGLGKDGNDNIKVNYDDVTIGIDTDTLEVKDGGIDTAQLALDAVDNTIIDLTGTYDFSSGDIQVSDTPAGGSSAVNKNYADSLISGLIWKDACRIASYNDTNWNTNVSIAFSAGTLTISNLSTQTGATRGLIDDVEPVDDDRILIKDAGSASAGAGADDKYNGLWKVTGGSSTSLTLVRTTDADTDAEVVANLACFISEGTNQADTAWTIVTDNPITVNTTPISFAQFNGAGSIVAGAGLDKTGNTLFIGEANKGVQVNADDLEVDASEIAGLGLAQNSVNSYELDLDLNGLSDTTIDVANDSFAFVDSDDSNISKKETIADLVDAIDGDGLSASAGVLSVEAETNEGITVGASGVAVDYDDATIGIVSNQLAVKDEGITEDKLDVDNAPTDGYYLKWTTANGMEWADVDGDVVTDSDVICNEIPSGLINSSNVTYTLANTPVAGTVTVYLNGMFQAQGAGLDYTVSGGTITFVKAPRTNSDLYVNYIIS